MDPSTGEQWALETSSLTTCSNFALRSSCLVHGGNMWQHCPPREAVGAAHIVGLGDGNDEQQRKRQRNGSEQ